MPDCAVVDTASEDLLLYARCRRWQRAGPASLLNAPKDLRPLLLERHSLTAALRQRHGAALHTRLVDQHWRTVSLSVERCTPQRMQLRRLRMQAGNQHVLEAISLLPAPLLEQPAFRRLRLLGDRALGDAIFNHSRPALRSDLLVASDERGWWRSSHLWVGGHSIALIEHFPCESETG